MRNRYYELFRFISEYSLYGILLFLPISISLVEIFAGFALIGFIGRKIIKPDFSYLKSRPNLFLLIFLFFNILSLLHSGAYFGKSLSSLFKKWFQFALLFAIIQDGVYDIKVIKRGILVFLSSACLVALSGLSQFFYGVEFLRNNSMVVMDSGLRAITSSFSHYNGLGAYLVVVVSLVCAMLIVDDRHGLKVFILLILGIFFTGVMMLTFSRGSWLSLMAALVFLSVCNIRKSYRLIPILIVIGAIFSISIFHNRLLFIFKPGGDSYRFIYWREAYYMIRDHPILGFGVGTFMPNFAEYLGGSLVYAHNCYLQIWAETGIFGLCSFLFFIFSLLRIAFKRFIISRNFLLLGLLSGTVGFLIHSFFDNHLYSFQLSILFWLWAGFMLGMERPDYEYSGKRCSDNIL